MNLIKLNSIVCVWFIGHLACSSTNGGRGLTDATSGGSDTQSPFADSMLSDSNVSADGVLDTTGSTAPPGGFFTNPAFCDKTTGFHSAVVAAAVAKPEDIALFAAELLANGASVVHHLPEIPQQPEDTTSIDDTVPTDTTQTGDITEPTVDAAGEPPPPTEDVQSGLDVLVADATPTPDVATEIDSGGPVWPGEDIWGEYVVMTSPLGDVTYLLSNGDMVVASACPLDSLGQVRRLDFALAKAIQILSKVQGTPYTEETQRWAVPTAYYADQAGGYWREYFNESLDLNKTHSGVISSFSTPQASAFGIYGHADTPSLVGDVIGVENLTVGGFVVVSDQKQTFTGEVALVWNLMPHLGAGEVVWSVDLLVSDASVGLNVGKYYPFIDALYSAEQQAAFTVTLQGTFPGVNRTSRAISELTLPPPPSQ